MVDLARKVSKEKTVSEITDDIGEATSEQLGLVKKKLAMTYTRSTGYAFTPSNTVILNTEIYDNTDGTHFNTSTGVFTAPKAAAYMVTGVAVMRFASGTTNSANLEIRQDANPRYIWFTQDVIDGASHDYIIGIASGIINCASGDTIHLYVSGTDVNQIEGKDGTGARTYLTITEID